LISGHGGGIERERELRRGPVPLSTTRVISTTYWKKEKERIYYIISLVFYVEYVFYNVGRFPIYHTLSTTLRG
jgi:hypothetical protein